jgi:hypothetical protein
MYHFSIMAFEYKSNEGRTPWRKYIIRTVAALTLFLIAFVLIILYYPYSDGIRVGTVQKFSRKGFIFKTYEGQLNMGVVNLSQPNNQGDSRQVGNAWDFSVGPFDKGTAVAIDEAMANEKRVKLYYKQMLYQFDWRGETDYFVYKVEPIQ